MTECFKIQLLQFKCKQDIFNISKGIPIFNLNADNKYLALNPVIIEADPFLFVQNDRLFLFYESKKWKSPGVLKMVSTTDLKHWTKPKTVLQEPYHLSFPWVFEEDGQVYMLPETGADNSIRVYKAINHALTEFKFVKELHRFHGDAVITQGYGDSCIYKKGGKYYLFTQLQYKDHVNTMELYVSDSLMGEYHLHPCSPIQHNQKIGRNAGSLMGYEGKLLRFSQDCTNRYGDNVHISEITHITPSEYEEKVIQENIIPTGIPFYKEGGHQFHAIEFKDTWIVATDAKEYHRLLMQRILSRIRRMFGL